ncbi:MAG: PilZ domain-containing protein [Candidatus Omnitrophica bacterium]|nr:PilZ domain-containing protein [Candidatus Omnitrophota bacterium]
MTPYSASDRREFFRIPYKTSFKFKNFDSGSPNRAGSSSKAFSQNISQTGILFQTETTPPSLSSIVWLSLDIRTLSICKEIEQRALICKDGILGRVVRVEENPTHRDAYDVGVCFLTQDQSASAEAQSAINELSK